jgi:hypothetical protein
MTDEPLTSEAETIIVAGNSLITINHQLSLYNEAVGPDIVIHKVITRAELTTVMALPADTPWCVVGDISRLYYEEMKSRFGMPQSMAACLKMKNNEVAIHPSKLRD